MNVYTQYRDSTDRRFTYCVCDVQLLPFPEESFDQVVANHTA